MKLGYVRYVIKEARLKALMRNGLCICCLKKITKTSYKTYCDNCGVFVRNLETHYRAEVNCLKKDLSHYENVK